jgi:hypothetical protein
MLCGPTFVALDYPPRTGDGAVAAVDERSPWVFVLAVALSDALLRSMSTVEDDRARAESDGAATRGVRGRRSFSEALLLQKVVKRMLIRV